MKENAPNKIFIIASFLIVLAVSVIDACTAPVFYALKDISLWGPVGVVSTVVTLLVIWWFKHLWNEIIPIIKKGQKINWIETCGLITLILLIKHLLP
jgi:hypothetical protein